MSDRKGRWDGRRRGSEGWGGWEREECEWVGGRERGRVSGWEGESLKSPTNVSFVRLHVHVCVCVYAGQVLRSMCVRTNE